MIKSMVYKKVLFTFKELNEKNDVRVILLKKNNRRIRF